jgi:hypothetical protein
MGQMRGGGGESGPRGGWCWASQEGCCCRGRVQEVGDGAGGKQGQGEGSRRPGEKSGETHRSCCHARHASPSLVLQPCLHARPCGSATKCVPCLVVTTSCSSAHTVPC